MRTSEVLWTDGGRWKEEKMKEWLLKKKEAGWEQRASQSLLGANEDPVCFCVWDVPGTLDGSPLCLSSLGQCL